MHVWAIRVRLQIQRRLRDLALFDIALDSKPRGCDVAIDVPVVAVQSGPATRGTYDARMSSVAAGEFLHHNRKR
jgi:hypothetical protein